MNQNQELELSFVRIYALLSESCCSHVMKIYSATSVFKYVMFVGGGLLVCV